MKQKILALGAAAALALNLAACASPSGTSSSSPSTDPSSSTATEARSLSLSDERVTLDGQTVTEEGAVTLTHDIVYYEAGRDAAYGEGTAEDEHTAVEAAAHAVVTIREAGTYRLSGSLSAGQIAVDLGKEAKTDPSAVVTLILDGADVTCTVAPALIFYNVYECDTHWIAYDDGTLEEYPASPNVDTSAAGANVILADGSENNFSGAYVARIYKEGTDKKLHKYDGAFYSKMSMNINGEAEGTGILNITASNEGLDSEVHLTINGGSIRIQAQNDGINTNEDYVSVTTINGGTVQINAGLGAEGDGMDSNGHLVINGGTVYTMANERTPDGGIDADGSILLNGGHVVAVGTRNDAAAQDSAQLYMELTFASTLPAGSTVELSDPQGGILLSFQTEKTAQAVTFSSPDLQKNIPYTLKINGVVQQYTGNLSGGFGPMGGGFGGQPGQRPEMPEEWDGQPPEMPENWDGQRPEMPENWQGQPPEMPENWKDGEGRPPRLPQVDGQPPEFRENGGRGQGGRPGMGMGMEQSNAEPSTEFTLTDAICSFSGVSDSVEASGKIEVTFSAEVTVSEDGVVSISNIQASAEVDKSHVQITVADVPSEDYSASCLWSDGDEAIANILPEDPGSYQLTISVANDDTYAGTSQFFFRIPETN